MNRAAQYVSVIVVAHLLINVAHGLAHSQLKIGLTLPGTMFVVVVILFLPLLAMVLVWTARKRSGLLLLSVSMLGSLLFGLYHHFLISSSDHVSVQPASPWGTVFVLTAYGLLITEVIGTWVGLHFLAGWATSAREV